MAAIGVTREGSQLKKGHFVSLLVPVIAAGLVALPAAGSNGNGGGNSLWNSSLTATNVVVSQPTTGGGYTDVGNAPVPGKCGPGPFNANHSESWLAVKPATDTIVGSSKFFFDKYSTFYNFYLGSYRIQNGAALNNTIVQGYDCTTVGTQAMPPSWTNTTDPNVDFDTMGRVYQTVLPFNAYWTNLHPNGEITVSYSDDLGDHWVTGNGGQPLEKSPNESSFSFKFEDKQWIAVNHFAGNKYADHVYAMWTVFSGCCNQANILVAVSRDRGKTFSKAMTIVPPKIDQKFNTYVYPGIDKDGTVYVAFAAFPPRGGNSPAETAATNHLWVTKSTDDGVTFGPFVQASTARLLEGGAGTLPNTTFRDGITENFAVSPTYPGHLYLTYEDWDGTQFDVKFTQSINGGTTWSTPVTVNDNAAGDGTDQFQPSVAAGPNGGVAVAFYDRRAACPNNQSIIRQDVGRQNFCIDTSLQAYHDYGAGAVPVGANIRVSNDTWDPQQPGLLVNPDGTTANLQTLGGLGQMACSAHNDPCTGSFIGDYFGLAISGDNIYTLSVSTHYPSNVMSDQGNRLFYQQQVLGTISRAIAGI
ncbi:MAG: exo-alpha-sialidase [Chloroflexi bacterium]|nr:MAG: exo-alpha-sialidase [Chloroflexota bacterium]